MIQFVNHVNLVNEAYMILYRLVNEEALEDKKERYASYYFENSDGFRKKFDAVLKINNYVKENLDVEKNTIEYFFKERDKNLCTIAGFIMFWDIKNVHDSLEDYRKKLTLMSEKERILKMVKEIEDDREISEDDMPTNLEEFIEFLNETSYDATFCWEIINILKHPTTYFEKIAKILTKTMNLIKDCKTELEFLEQSFQEYWMEGNSKKSVNIWIQEKFNVFWSPSEKGCLAIPSIGNPFGLTLALDEVRNQSVDVVSIGVMLDERLTTDFGGITKEEVVKIGKSIGDKSKLDILEFVSKRSAFGKEIAKELGLTTATISYHVNSLVELGFLKTELISGKVYYSTDATRIAEKLDLLKAYFYRLSENNN